MSSASKDSIHGTRLGRVFFSAWMRAGPLTWSGMWYLFLATMVVIPVSRHLSEPGLRPAAICFLIFFEVFAALWDTNISWFFGGAEPILLT